MASRYNQNSVKKLNDGREVSKTKILLVKKRPATKPCCSSQALSLTTGWRACDTEVHTTLFGVFLQDNGRVPPALQETPYQYGWCSAELHAAHNRLSRSAASLHVEHHKAKCAPHREHQEAAFASLNVWRIILCPWSGLSKMPTSEFSLTKRHLKTRAAQHSKRRFHFRISNLAKSRK